MPPPVHPWLRTLHELIPSSWLGLAALVGLVALLHAIYFLVLPRWAMRRFGASRPAGLRRYLEWVVATPSLLGTGLKFDARSSLASLYLIAGHHAEAEAHYRANLATLATLRREARFAAHEADQRRRLADCLEALGRTEEAEGERRAAEGNVAEAPDDALRHITRGTLLERENRHADAYAAYEQALAATPEAKRAVRVECMAHLFLAAFNAGRPADCLRWAEGVVALGADRRHLRMAHRMASVACNDLGRLEESEGHCRRALELAEADGERGEMGEILGSLADILRRRGRLADAHEAALRAGATDPRSVRMAIAVRAEALRDWGRFDEALAILDQDASAPELVIPHFERRQRAVFALLRSMIEVEMGRSDEACGHLEEAIAGLGTDAKLGLICDSAEAWVLAARGLADDSRRVAAGAEARLADFRQDPSTARSVLHNLGAAAASRGDHEAALSLWDRYLALRPDPINRPKAHYYRGICRLGLGDRAGARAELGTAVGFHVDSHHARLALGRLREIGPA